MNCRKLLVALCLCSTQSLVAQDIHLSQFYETPILRNPALIGLFNGDYRIQAVYRNQWNYDPESDEIDKNRQENHQNRRLPHASQATTGSKRRCVEPIDMDRV